MKHIFLSAALALAACAAQAQVSNGNFGNGTTGWNPQGDVLAVAGTLKLTTAYNADDDAPFNLSGSPAIDIGLVESGTGVPAYTYDLPGEPAYEGSIAKQTFAVAAGSVLSFQWQFSTLETLFQDRAFVVINGQATTLATRSTAPVGLQTYSRTFAGAGTVTLAFGVVDTGDYNGVSTLSISNVQLAAVPEPAAWLLMLAGAAVLARRVQARVR